MAGCARGLTEPGRGHGCHAPRHRRRSPTVPAQGARCGITLSLQAHPNAAQAAEGFARENALRIPLDSPERNYKDAFPTPELIYALSEEFDALCGFRAAANIRATFARLGLTVDHLTGDASLRGAFE